MPTTVDKFTSSCSLREREKERLKRNLDRSRDYFYSITISRDINDGVKGNNGWPTGVSIGG